MRRLVYAILNEDMGLKPSKDGLNQLRERESDVDAVTVRLVGGPGGTTSGAVDRTDRVRKKKYMFIIMYTNNISNDNVGIMCVHMCMCVFVHA